MTSGGSSETELSALTVIPKGRAPSSAETTVTPVTKWPITRRKTSVVDVRDRRSLAASVGAIVA